MISHRKSLISDPSQFSLSFLKKLSTIIENHSQRVLFQSARILPKFKVMHSSFVSYTECFYLFFFSFPCFDKGETLFHFLLQTCFDLLKSSYRNPMIWEQLLSEQCFQIQFVLDVGNRQKADLCHCGTHALPCLSALSMCTSLLICSPAHQSSACKWDYDCNKCVEMELERHGMFTQGSTYSPIFYFSCIKSDQRRPRNK